MSINHKPKDKENETDPNKPCIGTMSLQFFKPSSPRGRWRLARPRRLCRRVAVFICLLI